ncbi:MAG: hypothetical protein IKA37_06240 [Spirochaetales bacterium]|nr:hypothetical protein [Spirochaetales bacterium]MBR2317557.1 hypothetical protein [Spirochaetales bacterium]
MRFTKLHQWIKNIEPNIFKIGLSSFAVKELGEIVYIDFLKDGGENVKKEEPLAEIESLKSVNYFQLPFDIEIIEINSDLQNDISVINKDPENTGWLFVVKADENAVNDLLDEETYRKFAIAT